MSMTMSSGYTYWLVDSGKNDADGNRLFTGYYKQETAEQKARDVGANVIHEVFYSVVPGTTKITSQKRIRDIPVKP